MTIGHMLLIGSLAIVLCCGICVVRCLRNYLEDYNCDPRTLRKSFIAVVKNVPSQPTIKIEGEGRFRAVKSACYAIFHSRILLRFLCVLACTGLFFGIGYLVVAELTSPPPPSPPPPSPPPALPLQSTLTFTLNISDVEAGSGGFDGEGESGETETV